jgi:hypothetical protein
MNGAADFCGFFSVRNRDYILTVADEAIRTNLLFLGCLTVVGVLNAAGVAVFVLR